jgi:hypothetical protein
MGSCPVCHGCEDIPCQECYPTAAGAWTPDIDDDDWYDEDCR